MPFHNRLKLILAERFVAGVHWREGTAATSSRLPFSLQPRFGVQKDKWWCGLQDTVQRERRFRRHAGLTFAELERVS